MIRSAIPCLVALFLATTSRADSPGVNLSLAPGGKVRLTYSGVEGKATRLVFANQDERTHKVARSEFWKLDERCFGLDARGITVAGEPGCRDSVVELDWDERQRDRVYPGVVHLRNGGVLVFAGYIQVLTNDHRAIAPIRLHAPAGGIVAFRDSKSASDLVVDGSAFDKDGRGWFYFGPDEFVEEDVARIFVDSGVPPALRAMLLQLAPKLMRIYQERLGVAYRQRPAFYVTWSERERQARSWQADVVPGEIRFTVSGRSWGDAGPDDIAPFRDAVPHELAHLWNADVFAPKPWAAPWLSEGSAEFLSIAALQAASAITPFAAAERIQNATAECLITAGSRPWAAMRERDSGRVPYICGLAIQFAVVAAARRSGDATDAFSYWRAVWQEWPKYYEGVLAQHALGVGDSELAGIIQAMMTRSDMPLVDALRQLYSLGGLAIQSSPTPPVAILSHAGGRVMAALMSGDCQGSYGFWTEADHYFVDKIKCDSFKPGMQVAFAAGHDLFVEPIQAAREARAACAQNRRIPVKTRDGFAFDVGCGPSTATMLPGNAASLKFDPQQVGQVLIGHRGSHEQHR